THQARAARDAARDEVLPEGTIIEVRVEGNVSITAEQVRAKILSKAGGRLDRQRIEADMKTLHGLNWFSDVKSYVEEGPKGKGFILVFRVHEMPILREVDFLGMTHLKLKEVEEATQLKKGARADSSRAQNAVHTIKKMYEDKGYELAEIFLIEGGKLGDTKVVFRIFEGPKLKIRTIDFKGNTFASDATLMTKITSKMPILWLFGGKFHRDTLDEDVRKLTEYYQDLGFFEVKVSAVTRAGSSLGDMAVTYVVSEGVRYKVRKVIIEGNQKLSQAKLQDGMLMKAGNPMLKPIYETDRKNILIKYNDIGCIDTQVMPEPKYTDQPGVVDLVYRIEEGEPYVLGDLIIRGNERTKEKVIRREADMAAILPGQVLNINRLEIFKNRLSNTQYFNNSPEMGKTIEIRIQNKRPGDKPYGDGVPQLTEESLTRMQSAGAAEDAAGFAPPELPPI
ncbi:BamA/OMP85 family outer membrane protein, partial [Singulisphaera rosea]